MNNRIEIFKTTDNLNASPGSANGRPSKIKYYAKGRNRNIQNIKGAEILVKLDNDTIWLDAHLIATLFDVKRPAIVKHIQNIFKSGELDKISTCSILEQVAADGKKRKMNLYNLDIILSVGYRVNNPMARPF